MKLFARPSAHPEQYRDWVIHAPDGTVLGVLVAWRRFTGSHHERKWRWEAVHNPTLRAFEAVWQSGECPSRRAALQALRDRLG